MTKSYFLPAILWLIISTVLLTLPGAALPREDWLDKIWFDKWVHFGMFAIMVMLWNRAMMKKYSAGKKLVIIFLWVSILCLVYGIGMEFIQRYFIFNRSFDAGDIGADAVGCVAGFIYCLTRYIKK